MSKLRAPHCQRGQRLSRPRRTKGLCPVVYDLWVDRCPVDARRSSFHTPGSLANQAALSGLREAVGWSRRDKGHGVDQSLAKCTARSPESSAPEKGSVSSTSRSCFENLVSRFIHLFNHSFTHLICPVHLLCARLCLSSKNRERQNACLS